MEPEIVDYTPHCERRGKDGEYETDPLKPDENSYTPLLERADSPD